MTADLDLGVEIVAMPSVREPDGLAMSSRNAYLSPDERRRALALSRGLEAARAAAARGERDGAALVGLARAALDGQVDRVDYIELRDADTLAPLPALDRPGVLLIAAFVGTTRLIDNARL
jgi:pantoate--beta-alanine ligase